MRFRRTSSYYIATIAGVLIFLYFSSQNNALLGIILGVFAAFIAYKVVIKLEDALDKGVNTAVSNISGSRDIAEELLPKIITFKTSIDKEVIISRFTAKYPVKMPLSLKTGWACSRIRDTLCFICGVRSMVYHESNLPMCVAQLIFHTAEDGQTISVLKFTKYQTYNDGSVPFAKAMAELVGTIREIFLSLDADCQITETKKANQEGVNL